MLLQKPALNAKFCAPFLGHSFIPRLRLNEQLNKGIQGKLVLLSAPAGFGKTVLLSHWAQSLSLVGWVALDKHDNDVGRFWLSMVTALEQCFSVDGQAIRDLLHSSSDFSLEAIVNVFSTALMESPAPCVLVLDNYDVLQEQSIHDTLAYFLERLPPQLHLIIASRTRPPLPLATLWGYGQLMEIRAEQLCCTQEETAAFLTQMLGLTLCDEASQEIFRRTEGWIVGIRLLASTLSTCDDSSQQMEMIKSNIGYVHDYFLNEIVRRQPASVQTFLLRTSLLVQLSAPACDHLLEQVGSKDILEYLVQANLFVFPGDLQRSWYRYHPLFAEVLHDALEQDQGYKVPMLHHRASIWYERQGQIAEAIQHAFCAQEWQRSAMLIERHITIQSLFRYRVETVKQWLQLLPDANIVARPVLCLLFISVLYFSGEAAIMETWLQSAEMSLDEALAAVMNDQEQDEIAALSKKRELESLLGIATLYRACSAMPHDRVITLSLIQKARHLLNKENVAYQSLASFIESLVHYYSGDALTASKCVFDALVLAQAGGHLQFVLLYTSVQSIYLLQSGHATDAWHQLQQAVQMANEAGISQDAMMGYVYIQQAAILYEWNQLEEAREKNLQGLYLLEETEWMLFQEVGYIQLACISSGQGVMAYTQTVKFLRQAERVAMRINGLYYPEHLLINQRVRLWLGCGEVQRAIYWGEKLLECQRSAYVYVQERKDVVRIDLLFALRQYEEALQMLSSLLAEVEQQERWKDVLELLLLQVKVCMHCGQEQEAMRVLKRALQFARPERLLRCFLDGGELFASIVSQLEGSPQEMTFVLELRAAFQQSGIHILPPKDEKAVLLDPLSERELDVLRLLKNGASNQQIASDLMVTLSTVKGHVSNIFAKLEVSNRTQAVIRMRELGLLDAD